ncbi:MAG: ribose 5-phosphate isomerase B [Candidatus Methylacidiphilales bacterium]|nr:ribose 5-phosphate isomerase B [Candidatus Methylacidiphilales bacterium]
MRVAISSDHAGFDLKQALITHMGNTGHDVLDLGTNSTVPVDYPDCAESLCDAIRDGQAERGVLLCGSGVGASVAANKAPGIRAAICHDTYSAHQGVEHDDMNVLVIGARIIGPALARDLVDAYLSAEYTAEERHERRLSKVCALEKKYAPQPATASA